MNAKSEKPISKPWFLTAPARIGFWDRVKILFGANLFMRFETPTGTCHASCEMSWVVTWQKYTSDRMNWRWGNNWSRKEFPDWQAVCAAMPFRQSRSEAKTAEGN